MHLAWVKAILAVLGVAYGRAIKNQETLANPDALKHIENLPELKEFD
jgi:hypothetical protein